MDRNSIDLTAYVMRLRKILENYFKRVISLIPGGDWLRAIAAAVLASCVILLPLRMAHGADTSGDLKSGIDALQQLLDGGKASGFDGAWFSNQYRYGIKIKGKTGIATQSNSPKYSPGDVVLQIESLSKKKFQGKQIFTDGQWRPVTGQLVDANTFTIQGGGLTWTMTRVSAVATNQAKASSTQAAKQKPMTSEQAAAQKQGSTQSSSDESSGKSISASLPAPESIGGLNSVRDSHVGKFEIHGVRLGMKTSEARSSLGKAGWKEGGGGGSNQYSIRTNSDLKTIKISEVSVSGQNVVYRIHYAQSFIASQSGRFDGDQIRQQIINKYGTPNENQNWGAGYRLAYWDGKENNSRLSANAQERCRQEIVQRGKPQHLALGDAVGATHPAHWSSTLGSRVRESCPATLSHYLNAMKAYLAPQMNVSVGVQELAIDLASRALQEEPMIQAKRKEDERLKKAPPAKVDL